MNSAEYLTLFYPVAAVIFLIWELIQLARPGKQTMSQYITDRIEDYDKRGKSFNWWRFGAWVFIIYLGYRGFKLFNFSLFTNS